MLTFGPYQDLPASSSGHFTAHFENNNAFPRVTQLTRELEVSHWGNVYVDEKYYIKNAAAEHKGTWSRLDLQKNQAGFSKFALHKLIGTLPAQAHNLYFRDEIGNISSSNIRCISAGLLLSGLLFSSCPAAVHNWQLQCVSLAYDELACPTMRTVHQ